MSTVLIRNLSSTTASEAAYFVYHLLKEAEYTQTPVDCSRSFLSSNVDDLEVKVDLDETPVSLEFILRDVLKGASYAI
jgi:hypothetical protein